MNAERDVTRIVRSWLRMDEHESADRVLDSVLALLDATPQRRSWWPARRIADMNTFAKLAFAAAAVVLVAVVGVNLVPGGGVGGPPPPPSPSPTPSAQPAVSPSPIAVFPSAGLLAVGRHSMKLEGVPFSLDIPTNDWANNGCQGCAPDEAWIGKGAPFSGGAESAMIGFPAIDGVYTDPCRGQAGPSATSIAELADAVAAIPGVEVVTPPTDVTVGGHPAKHVAITIPGNIGCSPSQFLLWYDDAGCGIGDPCPRWVTAPGETNRIWIVDVDGTRFWVEAETYTGAGADLVREVENIVASIQFE